MSCHESVGDISSPLVFIFARKNFGQDFGTDDELVLIFSSESRQRIPLPGLGDAKPDFGYVRLPVLETEFWPPTTTYRITK